MKKILQTTFVLGLALVASAGVAQDFQAGLRAAETGDYETALKEWRPLAEQEYAAAQYNLGLMYNNGEGVPQNYTEAVRWYRMAAENGNTEAQYTLGVALSRG